MRDDPNNGCEGDYVHMDRFSFFCLRTEIFLYPVWPVFHMYPGESCHRKSIFSKTSSRVEIFENAVLLHSYRWMKTPEGFENDYVTVLNTSKCERSQRWYSFQPLSRFSLFRSLILATAISRKGCWKQCKRQSRKVLWPVLSLLFFNEI